MKILFIVIALMISGCLRSKPVAVEQAPTYQPPAPAATPPRIGVAQAPKLTEVQDAVKRIFKGAAVVHTDYNPSFLAGDFNGDASLDLAVVLKPTPDKLDEMNQEYPPWLLRDPRFNSHERQRLRVDKDEALLAVIHGFGANDWRDPEATQTFVLKNVVCASRTPARTSREGGKRSAPPLFSFRTRRGRAMLAPFLTCS